MRSKSEIISLLMDPGIIAVVRVQSAGQVLPLSQALMAGGIIAIEITMTTPNAIETIRKASRDLGPRAVMGVGTVLDSRTCREAIEAGAEFVVSPILRPEIANAARELDRPVMLGAYTPTEAQLAHEAGADFVKIFPADRLGPSYIKALRAPLPHLRIVPTGGVDLNTAADFLKAGCAALGVGSALISAGILRGNRWDELTQVSRSFRQTVDRARSK